MSGSPDISNPKLGTSTKETGAVGTALETLPEESFLNLAVITQTGPATVSHVIVLIASYENLIVSWSGYMNESGGSVSDYINTAIHGQYDTDFPELTSKFEKFSIGSSNNNSALF